jgi:hypothetical protein
MEIPSGRDDVEGDRRRARFRKRMVPVIFCYSMHIVTIS